MKYVIVIADGAADHPLDELGGRTPFEAAEMPHTDRLSTEGRQGTVVTTPQGMPCGSDVCTMSLLGYDPVKYHKGRAPLEAAAMGIEFSPEDWVFRLNLVTVIDGRMADHSAGHISADEGRRLVEDFAQLPGMDGWRIHPGVSYRNIMVDTSTRSGGGDKKQWSKLVTTPPHDIPGKPINSYLPKGDARAGELKEMIAASEALFATHEVNKTRRELGESEATHVWPWGQGQKPQMPSFEDRYGVRGAMITAVDLLSGLAALIGWDKLDVPGQTSYHDNDYAAAGSWAIDALERYDVVCVHVEAPDEASHSADAGVKVKAIEAIDRHVVGPVHAALEALGPEYRMLYMPDHYTAVSTRQHDPTPVPFAICGHQVNSMLRRPFNELNSDESDLHIEYGHELMEYFLFSGLPKRVVRSR